MYQDNFFNELIIDNFAGGGGASVGIELATGRPVDIAINHNDICLLADLLGHSNLETTRMYLKMTSREQREIVNKIIDW